MRLKRIKLRNFCQHEELDVEFKQGVVGIFGPNGVGKSNLIKAAYASLTGDFSRNAGVKLDNIRLDALDDPRAASTIESWWEHHGDEIRIFRGLKPEKQELTIGDKTYTRANDIAAELELKLGISKHLIDAYVFVDQWQMFDFLSMRPADRAKTFAHLCNTVKAEKIWAACGDRITTDMQLAGNDDDLNRRDELRARLSQVTDELAHVGCRIQALEGKFDADELQRCQTVVRNRERYSDLRQRAKGVDAELEKATATLDISRKRATAAQEAYDEHKQRVASLEKESQEARDNLVRIEMWNKRASRRKSAERERQEIKDWLEQHPKIPAELSEEDLERLASSREDVRHDLRVAKQLADSFDGDQVACPTCGTPVSTLRDRLEQARTSLVELTRKERNLSRKIDDGRKALTASVRRASERKAKLAALKSIEVVEPGEEPDLAAEPKLRKTIETYNECRSELAEEAEAVDELNKTLHKAEAQRASLLCRRTEYAADLKKLRVTPQEAKDAAKTMAKLQAIESDLAEFTGRATELVRREKDTKADLEEVLESIERAKTSREWVDRLSKLRSIFHRDALPRLTHDHAMESIVDRMNDVLNDFNKPFWVSVEPGLSFIAHLPNGSVQPAERLSGGLKVVLAVAFRVAINEQFAKDVGMLVFDEPTAGLHEANLRGLETALQRLGNLSLKTGFQIIMITHEERLAPVFGQTIQLG